MKTTKSRVYDVPTRLFHVLFALSFVVAFAIAKGLDDESFYYPYHMLIGLFLVFLVGLRIIWGFIGSRYARFSSFALKPSDFVRYFKDLITGTTIRVFGHNPASSWAALIMMGLAVGLGVTGYLMTSGGGKSFWEDAHELMANAFLFVALAHVAGVILHTLRHKDGIGLSMVHGKKQSIAGQAGIESSHRSVGILFVALIGAFVFQLNQSYDRDQRALNFLGTTLQLGEAEEQPSRGEGLQSSGDGGDEGKSKSEDRDYDD